MLYLNQFTDLIQAKGKYSKSDRFVSSAMLGWYFDEAKKNMREVAIGYGVVKRMDLNPDSKLGTNEIGEFISNFILNKDDLMYFKAMLQCIGNFYKKKTCF
jgi:3-isopropylmalate dehydrogenase